MISYGWMWLVMVGNCWKCLVMIDEIWLPFIKVDEVMVGYGWLRLLVAAQIKWGWQASRLSENVRTVERDEHLRLLKKLCWTRQVLRFNWPAVNINNSHFSLFNSSWVRSFSFRPPILPPIRPPIHPPIHPPIRQPIHPPIRPSNPPFYSSFERYIHQSILRSFQPPFFRLSFSAFERFQKELHNHHSTSIIFFICPNKIDFMSQDNYSSEWRTVQVGYSLWRTNPQNCRCYIASYQLLKLS